MEKPVAVHPPSRSSGWASMAEFPEAVAEFGFRGYGLSQRTNYRDNRTI
jgi:hypothetical protein